jgi:hypothetical protein
MPAAEPFSRFGFNRVKALVDRGAVSWGLATRETALKGG